jgi:hypothetical protein
LEGAAVALLRVEWLIVENTVEVLWSSIFVREEHGHKYLLTIFEVCNY